MVLQMSKATPSCHLLLSHSFSTEKAAKSEEAEPVQTSEKKDNAVAKFDYDEYDDYEEPKTAGQKVRPQFCELHQHCVKLNAEFIFCINAGKILLEGRSANMLHIIGRWVRWVGRQRFIISWQIGCQQRVFGSL